nr:uncharacterized protein LOC129387138 [Dermacentor andersoni]
MALKVFDRDMKILDIKPRFPGSCHVSVVWRHTPLRSRLETVLRPGEIALVTTTGSKAITWPLYRRLHGFLGALPINDDLLMEENIEVQQVHELPICAEVIASWDDGDIPTEESSVCQLSITPEPPTDSQTPEPSTDSPQPEVTNDLGARAGSRSASSKAKEGTGLRRQTSKNS